jgi:predicted methyltransferase
VLLFKKVKKKKKKMYSVLISDTLVDISDNVAEQTVVAEVNGQIWDMHRPLEEHCKIKVLTMRSRDEQLYQVCGVRAHGHVLEACTYMSTTTTMLFHVCCIA